jgi:hypothetical protein
MNLVVELQDLAICRLDPEAAAPSWLPTTGFRAVTWTRDETSIVCEQGAVPAGVTCEEDWRAIRVVGPLEFSLTGVLASLTTPLADASIPVFGISTFDTDYVLVKRGDLDRAIDVLRTADHEVVEGG